MKKSLFALLFLIFALPCVFCERVSFDFKFSPDLLSQDPPSSDFDRERAAFSLSPVFDVSLAGFGTVFSIAAFVTQNAVHLPDYDERSYEISSVNFIDRKLSHKYNKTLDHFGDASCALSLSLPFFVYGAGYFSGGISGGDFLTLSAMFAECYLLDYGAKTFLKVAIKRKRPYMYYEGFPSDALDDHDFEFSCPSGHTTDAFLGASFLSYTFCRYYPQSKLKLPVILASYSLASATAVLRVASGNHFLTDTIAGALLGSAIGFAVPIAHEFAASRSSKGKSKNTAFKRGDARFLLVPSSASCKVAL